MNVHIEYWNPQVEKLSAEGLHQLHEKKLLTQLQYVWKNSIFYQKKFEGAGVGPNGPG